MNSHLFLLLLLVLFVFSVKRDKVYVLSDAHINGMMTRSNEKELKRFLMQLTERETDAYMLVVSGDFIDEWKYSIYESAPHFTDFSLDGTLLTDIFLSILDNDVYVRILLRGDHEYSYYDDNPYNGLGEIDSFEDYLIENSLMIFYRSSTFHNYMIANDLSESIFREIGRGRMRSFEELFSRLSSDLEDVFLNEGTQLPLPKCTFVHALRSEVVILSILLKAVHGNKFLDNIPEAIEIYNTDIWPYYFEKLMTDGCFYQNRHVSDKSISVKRAVKKMLPFFEKRWKELNNYGGVNDLDFCFNVGFDTKPCERGYDDILDEILGGSNHHYSQYPLVLNHHNRTNAPNDLISLIQNRKGKETVSVNVGSWKSEVKTYVRIHINEDRFATKVDICEFTDYYDCRLVDSKEIETTRGHHERKITDEENSDEKPLIEPIKPPQGWTCSPDLYMNEDHVCYCNCSIFDPNCVVAKEIRGCNEDFDEYPICFENPDSSSMCLNVPKNKRNPRDVPKEFTCPNSWYGTEDGCDCECGEVKDPDCKGTEYRCGCSPTYVDPETSYVSSCSGYDCGRTETYDYSEDNDDPSIFEGVNDIFVVSFFVVLLFCTVSLCFVLGGVFLFSRAVSEGYKESCKANIDNQEQKEGETKSTPGQSNDDAKVDDVQLLQPTVEDQNFKSLN